MIKPAPLNSALDQSTEKQILVTEQAWRQWFSSFADNYNAVGKWVDPNHPDFGKVEPSMRKLGLMAFADGVNWNPLEDGTAGYFWWDTEGWRLLG